MTTANTTNLESDVIEVLATCEHSRGAVAHFVSVGLLASYRNRIVRAPKGAPYCPNGKAHTCNVLEHDKGAAPLPTARLVIR